LNIACKGYCQVLSVNHGTNIKKTAKANFAFVLNKNQYYELERLGFDINNIFIIPNSIEMSLGLKNKQNNEIPTIGFLGRISPEKGLDILFEAVKILKDKDIKFKLNIAGDGELLQNFIADAKKLEIENSVNFIGWVEDKKSFFDKIDIFCLPSKYEAFGIVLLEAMKYKTPIVSSNCDGPLDIFTDGKDALIFEKNNPAQLAEKLQLLIQDYNLRESLAQNAYDNFVNNYTAEIVGKKIEDALLKIVGNKP
jgi:glycosyltransferase involved in cell wall biosynthesis